MHDLILIGYFLLGCIICILSILVNGLAWKELVKWLGYKNNNVKRETLQLLMSLRFITTEEENKTNYDEQEDKLFKVNSGVRNLLTELELKDKNDKTNKDDQTRAQDADPEEAEAQRKQLFGHPISKDNLFRFGRYRACVVRADPAP